MLSVFRMFPMRLFHILMMAVFVDSHHQLGIRITVSLLRVDYGPKEFNHTNKANFGFENL